MARIEGTAGNLQEVDLGSLASRVTLRPMKVIGWNRLAAQTGLLTGIAAGGRIFSLRNTTANLIIVRQIGVGFMTTTAFTAAQLLDFSLHIARGFTVSDTVGTDVSPVGNVGKLRTSFATPNIAARISAAAVISGGTLAQDTIAVGTVAGGSTGLATGLPLSPDNMIGPAADGQPIVLAANEGITIVSNTAMGAAGVIKAYISVGYLEIAPADYG